MSRTKRSWVYTASFSSITLLCALVLMLAGSCSSDSPPATDTGPTPQPDTTAPQPDTTVDVGVIPDIGLPPDTQYVWPDTGVPADTWPHPSDSYSATPFGCTTDADCFGNKCCATPWGVKLCAPSCN